MSFRALSRALPLVVVMLVSACTGSTEPRHGPASALVLVSNAMFTATVGTTLAEPVVVRVTDDQDRPVPGAVVQFSIVQGAATLTATSDTTDGEGLARTTVVVGNTAGSIVVSASVTGITQTVQVSGVAVPGALARLIVQPDPLLLRAAGETGRLVASFADQFGNTLPPSSLTWFSLDPTIATVDATGLVTGQRTGFSTRVGARTASGVADTVTVSVADPNASVCGTAPVTLAPGQVTTLDPASGACIRATESSRYVAVPFYASDVPNNTTGELKVVGNGLATFTPSVAPMGSLSASVASRAPAAGQDLDFEATLRREEQRTLAPRMAAARQSLARRAASGARFSTIPNNLTVGSLVTLNASGTNACSTPINRTGRVTAISQHAVVVADTSNPTGGFDDADYARLAAVFDTLVVPVNHQTFGAPGDMDGNGRSVIFYTNAVNQLTPANSGSYVGGFFFSRDLFPVAECATSNQGEIFYMLVPDPTARYGNTFSKAFVERVTVGTIAHEYQHLINASRRLANPLVQSFETVWLNEGLSHIAEEMVFYRAAGLQPRSNIGGTFFGTPAFDQAFALYMNQNIGRLKNWLVDPQSNTPFRSCGTCTSTEDLATRGAVWVFLRYLADRSGPTDGDIWMRLVNNVEIGIPNVEEIFGVNFLTSVRDWSIAMYADDYAAAAGPAHRITSWNFRSLWPGLANSTVSTANAGPYPLQVLPLTNGVARSITLKGGSAAFTPFAVAAGTDAQVHVTLMTGGPVPPGVTVTILRTH